MKSELTYGKLYGKNSMGKIAVYLVQWYKPLLSFFKSVTWMP